MPQQSLTAFDKGNWEALKAEINRNTYPRINWKVILGMSLTRAVARCKTAGLNVEQAIKTIEFEHPGLSKEAKRRLRIGVTARFAEMGTALSEIRKVKEAKE